MDLNLTLEKNNRLEFALKGVPVPFANLLRRYGMGQVPVFAIDRVTFYENSSTMFDEYVSHRLGQVPLSSESSKATDEITLTLEAEGPGTVYSRALKSTDSKIRSALDNIPLLNLLEGQNLRLEAKARQGIGRQHSKFQPGIITYEMLSPNEFKFKAESFMQLEPRTFLSRAADIIIDRCGEFEEKLSEVKKSKGDKE
jgi:DNA-directed RNA polymerase subunit D